MRIIVDANESRTGLDRLLARTWNEVEVRQGAAVFADESELVERPAAADQEPHDGLSVGTGRGGRRQGSPEGALEEDDAEQAGYEQKGRGFIC